MLIIKGSKSYYTPSGVITLKQILQLCAPIYGIVKDKSIPLQVWSGPEGSKKLSFPDFVTTAQDGGKVVSLTHRPHLPPFYHPHNIG